MAKKDYYEILGVTKSSTADEIKKAYRKMALQYHPDKNQGNKESEEKFKEAAEAYEVLSDQAKKSRYDQFGHAGVGGANGGGAHMNMDDIFSQFGDVFGESVFGDFFGGGGGRKSQRSRGVRGSNIRIKVKLSLKEIAEGARKTIKVKKYIVCDVCHGNGAKDASSVSTCKTCQGSGFVRKVQNTILGQMATTQTCNTCSGSGQQITANCNNCHGSGRIYSEDTINIDIPSGVHEGIELSMSGKGNAGEKSGPNGDLLISIEETKDGELKREGNHVLYELQISFIDAALGTKVEVPTIDGKVRVVIPEGTQGGHIMRLKGKGLPSLNHYGKGDQIIEVHVWVPKSLSSEEKKILEKLKASKNFLPDANNKEKGFFEKMKGMFD